jgi:dsDNA-specific endonuclease/ATPase MutS2
MASRFAAGDTVQTRFGKGVVREIGNANRLTVDVQGRALVLAENEVSALDPARKHARRQRASGVVSAHTDKNRKAPAPAAMAEIDLHGLTVEAALDRMHEALSHALLADLSELRLIHGRSGGRIRSALHRRLRETPTVRKFRLDPRNEGVTIVTL